MSEVESSLFSAMTEAIDAVKTRYFHVRNDGLGPAADPARAALGEREWLTFARLSRLAGFDGALTPQTGVFIDAGCGDRYIETAVRQRGFDYVGLDIDTVNFEHDRLPFDDNSVDIFVSLAVIEHLRDPSRFLEESLRVLRPGGIIILSTPNFQMDFKNFYNDPTHVKPYTPAGITLQLRLSGFSEAAVFPGLRCKPDWYYLGPDRFWKARYLLPFRGDARFVPSWLKGRSTSLFALARKSPLPRP